MSLFVLKIWRVGQTELTKILDLLVTKYRILHSEWAIILNWEAKCGYATRIKRALFLIRVPKAIVLVASIVELHV